MIRRELLALPFGLALARLASAGPGTSLRKFHQGSMQEIKEQHAGEPFLLVLWSVTCVPCRDEFEILADLRQSRGSFPLVLVATDDLGDQAMAERMLDHYGLMDSDNWIFADPDAQRLRFEIDPTWQGEMPRSYFYNIAHDREAVSGALDRKRVTAWLDAEKL